MPRPRIHGQSIGKNTKKEKQLMKKKDNIILLLLIQDNFQTFAV